MTAVFNFLMIAGSVQGFVFNVATFLSRKKIEKPILYLNLFVLFLSLNNLQSWLIDKDFIEFDYYTFPFYVLLAPMFHAFLLHYLDIQKKRTPYFLLASIVFIAELMARAVVISSASNDRLGLESITLYNYIEDAVTLCFSLFIFYKVLQVLFRYQKLYPDILAFDDLKWIKRLIQLGGVILFLWAVAVVLNFVSDTIKAPYSYYPLRLATSIFIYWIGYQGFFRYVMLKDRIVLRNEIRKNKDVKKKVVGVKTEVLQKADKDDSGFRDIDAYTKSNQKYLDPYLSLESLAEELEIGTSSLSKIINTYGGSNFTDYINRLRVEEAKKLLDDVEFKAYTIVAIGLECGFNSKSTFYAAFKKYTDQTPTQYRDSSN